MAKADYAKDIEIQRLLKENSSLKNRLQTSSEREFTLKDKIQHLESSFNKTDSSNSIEKIDLSQIKLTINIRDEYQYEEIEALANDILKHGQLQPALITKDNFLLAGYRRYNAINLIKENPELFNLPVENNKAPNKLVCYQLDLNFTDLTEEQIDDLQFSENEQRKGIDHFQICKLFNRYLEKGFTQKYICEKFNKKKSYVSSVVSFKYIDPELVKWLKEFQVYAWSKEKFKKLIAINSENFEEKLSSFYEKNKGILAWVSLYQISSKSDFTGQKKIFLKLFHDRLTEEEINSDYFKGINEPEKNIDEKEIITAIKHVRSIIKIVQNIDEKLPNNKKKYIEQINKNVSQLETLLEKLKS